MKIEIPVRIEKSKIVENRQQLADHITSLEDGRYVIIIQSTNPLITTRDFQKAYFAMIDICVMETGNDRYTIHNAFKISSEVDSTKDFTIVQWQDYLNKFRYWSYNELNVIV